KYGGLISPAPRRTSFTRLFRPGSSRRAWDSRNHGMRQLLMFMAVLPLTAACASVAPTRAPNIATPATFEAQVETGAPIALDRWWTVYGDQQLEQLVAEAFANGPDGRIIAARLVEARATYFANRASAFPT